LGASFGAFPARGRSWAAISLVSRFIIYLLFFAALMASKIGISHVPRPTKTNKEHTILFGSILPSSNKWALGVHVNGGVIYAK